MPNDFDEKAELLIREIEGAFADVPYPGDDNISVPTYDDEGTAEYFAGRTQKGHTAKDLRSHSSALSFFTLDAFHYFLSAYVIAVLRELEEADIIYEALISQFNYADSDRIVQCLSASQRQAMIRYFEYCLSRYGGYLQNDIACAINLLKSGGKA